MATQAYNGPWLIRDHRTMEQVMREENWRLSGLLDAPLPPWIEQMRRDAEDDAGEAR